MSGEEMILPWARFCDIPLHHPACQALAEASQLRSIAAGETLIKQGDRAGPVYLVLSGHLRAVKYSENGHKIWLSDIGKGGLVGEVDALTKRGRSSFVDAYSDSQLLGITQQVFDDLSLVYAEISRAVSRMLAHRLADTSNQLTELTTLSVRHRLHSELKRLGERDPDNYELLNIPTMPAVIALAERIHTSRESASRALSELERLGIVQRVEEGAIVIDPRL